MKRHIFIVSLALFGGSVGSAGAVDIDNTLLVQRFIADGDAGQCNGGALGERILSAASEWSPAIRVDTDNRSGGCLHSIGIVDPGNELEGLEITVNFFADGEAGQCGNPGLKVIPRSRKLARAAVSDPMRYDMDDRSGGCQQVYSLRGRNDVALQIEFLADGDAGQCGNAGVHTVFPNHPAQIRLDTDNRSGGCRLRYRLVER